MSLRAAQARIQSQVWQAIAQGEVDLSGVERSQLEALVKLVTEAALVEMNQEMGEAVADTATDRKSVV